MFYKSRVNIPILVIQREIAQFYPMQTRDLNLTFPNIVCARIYHHVESPFLLLQTSTYARRNHCNKEFLNNLLWSPPRKRIMALFWASLKPLLVQNRFIYLWKIDSARRTQHRKTLTGWQALVSRKNPRLKSLNQTGGELILAQAHLGRMPPTLNFYHLTLWWKLVKPLGYTHLREGLL